VHSRLECATTPRKHPRHRVVLDGFGMQTHQVTNTQFAEFITATGYLTVAERPPLDAPGPTFPAPRPRTCSPVQWCFTRTHSPVDLRHIKLWWTWTPGASWRHPEGPGSSIASREDHPVVHVAFEDAAPTPPGPARSLPTESGVGRPRRGGYRAGRLHLGR